MGMRHVRNQLLAGLGRAGSTRIGKFERDRNVRGGTVGTGASWARTLPRTMLRLELRRELAARWSSDVEDAQRCASIFATSSLALLRLGAPPGLLAACQEASLDELDHAQLALGLAKHYVKDTTLESWPATSGHEAFDLELLAVRWVREGCVGKTIAAALAEERLRRATDPLVRRALGILVDGHTRHAELSYRLVAWATEVGGTRVRRAVHRCFEVALEQAQEAPVTLRAGVNSNELNAHGWLGPFQIAHLTRRAILDVVEPCRARLFHVEEEVELVARVVPHALECDAPTRGSSSAGFEPLTPTSARLPASVALRS